MSNKNIIAGLVLGGLAAVLAPSTLGNTVVSFQSGNFSYSDGGEFQAKTTPQEILGLSLDGSSFQTFCVQSQVYFHPGTSYNYSLSLATIPGAVPLTKGTAWLFDQFSVEALSGYDYTLGAGRKASAGKLQAAIWYFQGQTFPNNDFLAWGNGVPGSDAFTDAAIAALGGLANAMLPSDGSEGVRVMNLTTIDGKNYAQNWLARVPDGGTTLLMLGMGLSGLAFLSRRMRS